MENKYYVSPRWTGEILDCSMPVTFDTYNKCSYNCLYCFSYYQKSHTLGTGGTRIGSFDYQKNTELTWVDKIKIKKMLTGGNTQFKKYFEEKITLQWGGLADQFDEYERKNGVTLELLKFFKQINYPICFSTKSTWVFNDDRYLELFKNQNNWNMKISIINLDENKSKLIEKGVDAPTKRLQAGNIYSKINKGGFTLRLRPFIIGLSDIKNEYIDLIKLAHKNGATAVTTEFFCLERRANDYLKKRYNEMSEILGFDIYKFYVKHSRGSGYLRLNYDLKKQFILKMQETCGNLGLRFYVSDAHHKEKCHNASCCGLDNNYKYALGTFTNALLIAKEKGFVKYSDIEGQMNYLPDVKWDYLTGFNTGSNIKRAQLRHQTIKDYFRFIWNNLKSEKNPARYFAGMLLPEDVDKEGNIIYKYNKEKK